MPHSRQPLAKKGPATLSAADRTRPASSSAGRRIVIGGPGVDRAEGPGILQRMLIIGHQTSYTDLAAIMAAAKTAGVDLSEDQGVIQGWLAKGNPRDFADWHAVKAAASGEQESAATSVPAPVGLEASPSHTSPHTASAAYADSERKSEEPSDQSDSSDEESEPAHGSLTPSDSGPGSSAFLEDDDESRAAHREALKAKRDRFALAAASSSSSPSPAKAVVMDKSSIRHSQTALEAAGALNMSARSLKTRNPHKTRKTGGGGGGTDHQRADGKAARSVADTVAEGIRKASGGAHLSPADFLHGRQRAAEAETARNEKRAAATQREIEADEADEKDRLDWIASLAPKEWRDKQATLENSVRPAPDRKRLKRLATKAAEKGWPQTWDGSLASQLYR